MDSFYFSFMSSFHVFNGCFPYIKGGVLLTPTGLNLLTIIYKNLK